MPTPRSLPFFPTARAPEAETRHPLPHLHVLLWLLLQSNVWVMLQNLEQPLPPCPRSLIYSCYPPTLSERSWNKTAGSSPYFPNQSPLSFLPAKGLCQRLVVAPVLGGPVLGGVCGVGVLARKLVEGYLVSVLPIFPRFRKPRIYVATAGNES